MDVGLEPGAERFYGIVSVDASGSESFHGPYRAFTAPPVGVLLHRPQPNPFNPNTILRVELPSRSPVSLRVFSAGGRLVRTLLAGESLPAGIAQVPWDGLDDDGRGVASGVYLVMLDALGVQRVQRAVMVR